MRLPILFIVLFITNYVCADGLANGYERLWIYYSYLLDVKAASVNGGHRSIVIGCKAPDCTFRDIMQEISKTDLSYSQLQFDESNRFPPLKETAKLLFDGGLTERYKFRRVVVGAESFPDMIEKMGMAIDWGKDSMNAADRLEMQSIALQVDESLRLAKETRSVELSSFIMREQNQMPDIKFSTIDTDSGKVISWEKTEADNSHVADVRQRIDEFLEWYYQDDNARGHKTPIDSMEFAYNTQRQISCGN